MPTAKKPTAAPAKKAAAKTSTAESPAPAAKEKSLTDLTSALAEQTGLSKAQAKEFLDAHAELLVSELQTAGSVQLAGIGKLKLGNRPERQGRNPSTGETITIKAAKTIRFSGGKKFKDSFNS